MKPKSKTRPPKKRTPKAALRKKTLTPDQIAAEVRAQLAPAIAPLGIVANTVQFLDRIERMAATLAVWGPKINLTAHPRDPDEIVFHVFDSIIPVSIAASAKILHLGRTHRMLDVGSGAGFPGLVLAAAINASVTLVEARRKRATYLTEAAIEMGLQNVRVECARAESLDLRDSFDLVTSRAVFANPIRAVRDRGPRAASRGRADALRQRRPEVRRGGSRQGGDPWGWSRGRSRATICATANRRCAARSGLGRGGESNVEPTAGSTPPWASTPSRGVTPAPSANRKVARSALLCSQVLFLAYLKCARVDVSRETFRP